MVEEILNPIWDIAQKTLSDNSIQQYDYFEIRESNVNVQTLKKFEFISKDTGSWVLPSKAYIHLRCKIPNITNENVSLVNNGYNIFSSAEYEIEKAQIEKVDYLGISTTVQNLVDFSYDYSKNTATNMFWFPDTSEKANKVRFNYSGIETVLDTNTKLKKYAEQIKSNTDFNMGHNERSILTQSAKQVSLFLPLSRVFGFCKQDRVFIGMQHTFRFVLNDINNMLFTDSNTNFTVEINHISIFMPYAIPSIPVQVGLEKILAKDLNVEIQWNAAITYRSDLRDDKDFNWRITTTQYNPVRAFIIFQESNKENNQKYNNMIFDHMNVRNISITLNDRLKFPVEDYECDFNTNTLDYARIYQSFLSAGYKNIDCDSGTIVSYQDFMRLYPIFHIDLSRKPENLFENRSTCDINLKVKLDKIPSEKYYAYCVLISEKTAIMNPTSMRTMITVR